MTREQVETMAKNYYTKDEIKILLRGFDLGMAHARDLVAKAVFEESVYAK